MWFNWEIAPSWANWVAQDSDGEWYYYEDKPYININCWQAGSGESANIFHTAISVEGWKNTLLERN